MKPAKLPLKLGAAYALKKKKFIIYHGKQVVYKILRDCTLNV